jgi:hypothetical protein
LTNKLKTISSSSLKEYLSGNSMMLVFAILIVVISFGYELFNFTLTIDEELMSFMMAKDLTTYINLDRWGNYWLNRLLMPESVLPYLPTLIALLCMAGSAFLLIAKRKGELLAAIIFFVIFLSSPVHSYWLAFSIISPYIAIGMLVSTIGFLSFEEAEYRSKNRWILYLFSVLGLTIAISVYQALLAYFLTLIAFYLFSKLQTDKELKFPDFALLILRIGVICGISFGIYYVIGLFQKKMTGGTSGILNHEYLSKFILWDKESVGQILSNLSSFIIATFFPVDSGRAYTGAVVYSVVILLIMIVFFVFRSKLKTISKTLSVILLLVFVLSPFAVMFLNGAVLPPRTFMALPLMMGLLWWLVYRESGSFFKKVLMVVALFIFIGNIQKNTRLFYSSHVANEADYVMASRIVSRIDKLKPEPVDGTIQVSFIGKYSHPVNPLFIQSAVHGSSFFWMNVRGSERLLAFLKIAGFYEFNLIPQSKYSKHSKVLSMPSWPEKGAVRLIGNTVVVKLSEPIEFSE